MSKRSSWVTEESSNCSVTESERFLPLYLLSSTLGLIILLQQSKLRNESNGNLGLCPLGRFFFPLRRKRAGALFWGGRLAQLWKFFFFLKVLQPFLSILKSRARESQYDICLGFSNETKHFFSFSFGESHTTL